MRPLRSGNQYGQTRACYRAEEKGEIPAHFAILHVISARFPLNRLPRPAAVTTQWLFGRIKAVFTRGITDSLTRPARPGFSRVADAVAILRCHPRACGEPVRRGFSVLSSASLGCWVVRS